MRLTGAVACLHTAPQISYLPGPMLATDGCITVSVAQTDQLCLILKCRCMHSCAKLNVPVVLWMCLKDICVPGSRIPILDSREISQILNFNSLPSAEVYTLTIALIVQHIIIVVDRNTRTALRERRMVCWPTHTVMQLSSWLSRTSMSIWWVLHIGIGTALNSPI